MALSRVKEWVDGEVLTDTDLDAEFDNIIDNPISLISPLTNTLDADGKQIILDADGDTSITSDSDDVIDIEIAGTDSMFIGHGTGNTVGFVHIDPVAHTTTADTDYGIVRIGNTNAITIPATTTAVAAGVYIETPNWTATGTITESALLYLGKPANEGANDYSLLINTESDTGNAIRLKSAQGDHEAVKIENTTAGATASHVVFFHNSASPNTGDDLGTIDFNGADDAAAENTYVSILAECVDPAAASDSGKISITVKTEGVDENIWEHDNATTTINKGQATSFRWNVDGDGLQPFFQLNGTADQVTIAGAIVSGGATGGNKGSGTINAKGVYDDDNLLTCYVFDQALDGSIDLDKWDKKVPDRVNEVRQHDSARKFIARIGTEHDPLDIDAYAKHWKEKRHLTAMPNETKFAHSDMSTGEWVQRLTETVEVQAVLIEQLNQRLKILEA